MGANWHRVVSELWEEVVSHYLFPFPCCPCWTMLRNLRPPESLMFVQSLLCYCRPGQCCEPAHINKAGPRTPLHGNDQDTGDTCTKPTSLPAEPGLGSNLSRSNFKPVAKPPCRRSSPVAATVPERTLARGFRLEWAQETRPVRLGDIFCPVETGLCFSVS